MFPSCWNGKDLDSADHKSHMAYPNLVMSGDCPSGFETRTPSLFYETIWNTYAYNGVEGEFVLSNGDPTGMWGRNARLSQISNINKATATMEISSPDGTLICYKTQSRPAQTLPEKSLIARCSISRLRLKLHSVY